MTFFFLHLLFSCAIFADANGHNTDFCRTREIDGLCATQNELQQPQEILWSGPMSSISLQVKASDLKQGKTGRIYHTVRTPPKLLDRQVKKRSTIARRSMKRGVAAADDRMRRGAILAHSLAKKGIIGLDNGLARGSKIVHDYVRRASSSLDNKLVTGTRSAHHTVKHTLLPVDKRVVHGSSRGYSMFKKGVTTVDKRIKNSVREVDKQLASGGMKGVPMKVPVKLVLSSLFKRKGQKSKTITDASPPTLNNEPEPAPASSPATELSEVVSSEPEALPSDENVHEMKAASAESVKHSSIENMDDHGNHFGEHGGHSEEPVSEKYASTSAESVKGDAKSDFDMDDHFENTKLEDHDHNHDHDHDHDHDLADHSHHKFDDIDHMDDAYQFDDLDQPDEHGNGHLNLNDSLDEFEHDQKKETVDGEGHPHDSTSFDGVARSVRKNASKKKRYFQDKIKQVAPRGSPKLMWSYSKSMLPKNVSRSLTKISKPSPRSSTKNFSARSVPKSSKMRALSKNTSNLSKSLLSKSGVPRSLLSKSGLPKSLSKARKAAPALKARAQ